MDKIPPSVKVLLVGDSGTGKQTFVDRRVLSVFPGPPRPDPRPHYAPKFVNELISAKGSTNKSSDSLEDPIEIQVAYWILTRSPETSEQQDRRLPHSFATTCAVALCYDSTNKESLLSAVEKVRWWSSYDSHTEKVAVVSVCSIPPTEFARHIGRIQV